MSMAQVTEQRTGVAARPRGLITGHPRASAGIALAGIGVVIFVLVWFQPQKLFFDTTVSEQLDGVATTLAAGPFAGLSHDAAGTAQLVALEDGTRYLRFAEDFRVENGPDLVVWLSAAPAGGEASAHTEDFVLFGTLKGNVGSQNYELPAGIDLERYRTAVVWCRRFNVGFAAAPVET